MWIAREENGLLALWSKKPYLGWYDGPKWMAKGAFTADEINKELFPEVTFENSPVKVELKIKDNNESKQDRQKESIR